MAKKPPTPPPDDAEPECLTLNLTAAAREIGVTSDTVMRWIEAGHLPVFVPPGHDFGSTRGASSNGTGNRPKPSERLGAK
jgi:hypothetical protein